MRFFLKLFFFKLIINEIIIFKIQISQASVLFEGGKYIKNLRNEHDKIFEETQAVKKQIDDLNNYIE